MAQPLLVKLKKSGATLHVLAPDWVAPVARRMPEVDEVIAVPFRHGAADLGGRWRLARALAKRGYDRAIVLPNSWKSALVPFLAGIPQRAGYVGELRYGLLNSTLPNSKLPMPVHYARLAGGERAQPLPQPHLEVSETEIADTRRRFGIEARYAVLCPGAEYGPAKRWPGERVVEFCRLAADKGATPVLLGAPGDTAAAGAITASVRVPSLVGRDRPALLPAVLAELDALVSGDTGVAHLAAALGTPVATLFGPTDPRLSAPRGRAAVSLTHPVPCAPCFYRACPIEHPCLRGLTATAVYARVLEVMHA